MEVEINILNRMRILNKRKKAIDIIWGVKKGNSNCRIQIGSQIIWPTVVVNKVSNDVKNENQNNKLSVQKTPQLFKYIRIQYRYHST